MLTSLALALLSFPNDIRLAQTRSGLEVNEYGVLTSVPAQGLASVDGPPVELQPGFAEWFGVEFTTGAGFVEAVGPGARPDWAGRPPVSRLGFASGEGWAVSMTAAGPLEIRTQLELEGELLFATVELTNRGPETLKGVFYTREWLDPSARGWTFPTDFPLVRPAPERVSRRVWMLDDLPPGASSGVLFSYSLSRAGSPSAGLGGVEVPLRLFRNADWPDGVVVGATNGLSFGDYDADGWIDMFACQSARLLRNEQGMTWRFAADLDSELPSAGIRYGSSFGDYDNDGLQDIGTEPRPSGGDSCLHLLHNLGGGPNFDDVATDPAIVIGQPCNAPSETICWGDVEDDGDLDLFLPVYPGSAGGPGNFFLENLGPTGPLGAYRLIERSAQAGLDNPPGSARPEGAQFIDIDFDGDIDLYSNGTLYQNRSEQVADFDAMTENGSGIGLSSSLDEGAVFFDYDLDGDLDLFVVYTLRGVRLWECRGDGTFFAGAESIIDQRNIGLDLGMSAEDWDNDGDVDFTTRQVFRRNRWVEDGDRHFTVATHSIPPMHLTSATPAWGDWDKDGDLDCALGNWLSTGHFYENVLYDEALGLDQKPFVRVRILRDSEEVGRGLETEYGACAEIRLHGDASSIRRRKFVASGHGYLNQNEYVLHFALPSGPDPSLPVAGLVFDLVVDFPGRPSRGLLQIDRHVNAALGDIALESLAEREITVFRSGRVIVEGVEYPPDPGSGLGLRLMTTAGGLALPDRAAGLPAPVPAPGTLHWVGIDFATAPTAGRMLVEELVLDGQLDDPSQRCPFNLALWDVTDPLRPARVFEQTSKTSERNRRSAFPFEVWLDPGRVYRCVAHVRQLRGSPIDGPVVDGSLVVKGGLSFQDLNPCSGKGVVRASLDREQAYLALRYRPSLGRRASSPPPGTPASAGVR